MRIIELIWVYMLPLCFVLSITLGCVVLFRERFERIMPIGIMIVVLVTYFLGFIDLRIGLILSLVFAGISVPLFLFMSKRNCSISELIKLKYIFLIIGLYTIFFVLNFNKGFIKWDEYSHWGPMVKEMVRLDSFYYVEDSRLVWHREYPPFISIWLYLWSELCGDVKEYILYNAQITFIISLHISLYSYLFDEQRKDEKHKITKSFLVSIFIILLCLMDSFGQDAYIFRTIYIDPFLGCMILYGLFGIVYGLYCKKNRWIYISIYLSSLILTKQIAIFWTMIFIFAYFSKFLFKNGIKETVNKLYDVKILLCNLTVVISPVLTWGLWKVITDQLVIAEQFDSGKFSLDKVIAVFMGNGMKYQNEVISLYFDAIFFRPVLNTQFLGISYLGYLVLNVIVFYILIKIESQIEQKKNLMFICGFEVLTAVFYAGVILISYLFGFSQVEALGLACIDRYLSIFIYPSIVSTVLIILIVLHRNFAIKYGTLMFGTSIMILCLLIPYSRLKFELEPGILAKDASQPFESDCERIKAWTEEDSKIMYISQGDNGGRRNIIAYEVLPRKISLYSTFGNHEDNGGWSKDYTLSEFERYASEFDYIYFGNVDQQFEDRYFDLFDSKELENNQLYRVRNGVKYQLVNIE